MTLLTPLTLFDDANGHVNGSHLDANLAKSWTSDVFGNATWLEYWSSRIAAPGSLTGETNVWWNDTYGPDQRLSFIYGVNLGQPMFQEYFIGYLRLGSPGTFNANGYRFYLIDDGSGVGPQWFITSMFDSFSWTVITSTTNGVPVVGDRVTFEARGPDLTIYVNEIVVLTVAEFTWPGTATTFGIGLNGTNVGIDDVYFGDPTIATGPVNINRPVSFSAPGLVLTTRSKGLARPHAEIVQASTATVRSKGISRVHSEIAPALTTTVRSRGISRARAFTAQALTPTTRTITAGVVFNLNRAIAFTAQALSPTVRLKGSPRAVTLAAPAPTTSTRTVGRSRTVNLLTPSPTTTARTIGRLRSIGLLAPSPTATTRTLGAVAVVNINRAIAFTVQALANTARRVGLMRASVSGAAIAPTGTTRTVGRLRVSAITAPGVTTTTRRKGSFTTISLAPVGLTTIQRRVSIDRTFRTLAPSFTETTRQKGVLRSVLLTADGVTEFDVIIHYGPIPRFAGTAGRVGRISGAPAMGQARVVTSGRIGSSNGGRVEDTYRGGRVK